MVSMLFTVFGFRPSPIFAALNASMSRRLIL
jgi:hypothetical protein